MQPKSIPLVSFSLVVVRNNQNKFLSVLECGNQGWWLPGGRVEQNQKLSDAAIRECKQESGIDVKILGILRIENTPRPNLLRQRIIYYGEPVDENQKPKSIPDGESIRAEYLTLEEIVGLKAKWRGSQLYEWAKYLSEEREIYPMELILE